MRRVLVVVALGAVAAGCGSSSLHSYTLQQVKRVFAEQGIPLQREPTSSRRAVILVDPAMTAAYGYQFSDRGQGRGYPVVYLVFVGDGPHGASRGNVYVTYAAGEGPAVQAAKRRLG